MINVVLAILSLISIIGVSLWIGVTYTAIGIAYMTYKNHYRRLARKRFFIILKCNCIILPISTLAVIDIIRKSNNLEYIVGGGIFNTELLKTFEYPLIGILGIFMTAVLLISLRLFKEFGGNYNEHF